MVGQTDLVARVDGVVGTCKVCGRDTHYGAKIETVRHSIPERHIELFACYDCIEVCHLIAVGRMPCEQCHGKGHQ